MQVVILAGGLATRLGALSQACPKSMLRFKDKPFLDYQLALFRAQGYSRFLICVGHLGEQIQAYFGDGKRWGVEIQYSVETASLLGTGGALNKALSLLEESFFVTYGDSYLKLNFKEIEQAYLTNDQDGLMVVYRNQNQFDRSNVVVKNGLVADYGYDSHEEKKYIDEGISVLTRKHISEMTASAPFALGEVFKKLIAQNRLHAFETTQRFFEIGSHQGYEEFAGLVEKGDL